MDSDFEPLILGSRQLIDEYWIPTAPVLEKCIKSTMEGEQTIEHLYHQLVGGEAAMIVLKRETEDGPEVKLAVVVRPMIYKTLSALEIIAVGGSELDAAHEKFWETFRGWAYLNGARAIECHVSPAMERIIKKYGFERTAIHMRMPITEV